MTIENIKEELETIADYRKKEFVKAIQEACRFLLEETDLTIEDIANIMDTSPNRIDMIISPDWDGRMSSKMCIKLDTLISCFPHYKQSDNNLDEFDCHKLAEMIKEYTTPQMTREEKIEQILDLFGVKDSEDGIDRLLSAITDVRSAINKANEGCVCCCNDKKQDDRDKPCTKTEPDVKPTTITSFIDDIINKAQENPYFKSFFMQY